MSLRKTWTVLDGWSQYKWEGEKAEVAGTKHSRAATVTAALAHGICSASENHEIFRSEHRYDLHMPPSGSLLRALQRRTVEPLHFPSKQRVTLRAHTSVLSAPHRVPTNSHAQPTPLQRTAPHTSARNAAV